MLSKESSDRKGSEKATSSIEVQTEDCDAWSNAGN